MMRQYIGAARTVASTPVAPLSNCTSAAAASRGSGGGFCRKSRASTLAMGPARLTKASITCRPAPVMPPPGDSARIVAPAAEHARRVLVGEIAFDMQHLADGAVGHHALELAHRGKAALVVAERERHAGLERSPRPRAPPRPG